MVFEKKITTFPTAPPDLVKINKLALIEYSGRRINVPNEHHGNCRIGEPYVRTDPEILKNCASQARAKPATEVCYLAAKDNSVSGPKSARQIRDKLYREKQKSNRKTSCNNNIADEIVAILAERLTNPCLKKVEFGERSLPNIFIYSDNQLEDMKANCVGEGGSIIGIDRTFNLGKCFVTSLCYKNQGVVNRKTNEAPIMLGPLFLHWDGATTTYHSFFSHLRAQLGDVDLTIGSDEERAMTKALRDCFHNATFLLCSKHIRENIISFLEKTGTSSIDWERIIKIIFAEDWIVFSKNDFEFSTRLVDLELYFEKNLKFQNYWERYLESKLKKYVTQPLQDQRISTLWTNNNSESMNNRLKQVAEFKQHKLPELVEKNLFKKSRCWI